MTLKEAFTGKKPDVGHFRIFRSLAYFHILGDTCTKLEKTSKAYRIFIPRTKRIIVKCDVKLYGGQGI